MLHHVSIGVADVGRAAKFYDSVLKTLGYKRIMEFLPYGIGYGEGAPEFWVQLPHDGGQASAGNGIHICFAAADKRAVHAFHEAALKAGGRDEGGPGPRPEYSPHYYGCFARDLDGNKIEAVFFGMSEGKPAAKAKAKPKAKAEAMPKTKPAKTPARKVARKKKARR
jgi:catechol 2,3-dioxygenase-like lactoylglutathione lyase family enzyme